MLFAARWRSHPFARPVVAVIFSAAVLLALPAEAGASLAPGARALPPEARQVTVVQEASELENEVLAELNAVRSRAGMPPLRRSRELARAAVHHSRAMAREGFFAHRSSDGSPFWRRIQRFYPRRWEWQFYVVGENLLRGGPNVDASTVVRHWLRSPTHRRNVFGDWREVGVGAVRVEDAPGVYDGETVAIVTADFGMRG